MGVCQKQQPIYLGPFEITQKFNDLIFNIHLGPNDSHVVHHNKLKKYEGEDKPERIRKAEDTMSVLSNSTCDCTVTSKQKL